MNVEQVMGDVTPMQIVPIRLVQEHAHVKLDMLEMESLVKVNWNMCHFKFIGKLRYKVSGDKGPICRTCLYRFAVPYRTNLP